MTGLQGAVFGAAGLLGPIWVETLLKKCDVVFCFGLDLEKDESLLKIANANFGRVHLFECDLVKGVQLKQEDFQSKLDFAIFNAGKDSVPTSISQEVPDLTDFSEDSWLDYTYKNLMMFINSLNFFCRHRNSSAYGVVIGSMYASIVPRDTNYMWNGKQEFRKHPGYGAAKSGIKSIMQQYAARYASEGLILNMLSPGVVENGQPQWFRENILSHLPSGKLIDKAYLESVLDFLTSPACEHLIGHDLILDGGYHLW